MKTFPILDSCVRRCKADGFHTPRVVSFDLVKRHERQALTNHSQTVERLADRGGLSWFELLMVMTDSSPSSEYFKRIEGMKLTGREIFRIVANVMMHEFSKAYGTP